MIHPKPLPSQQHLCQLLRYEPDTGKLYWVAGKRSGREAFTVCTDAGYRLGWIDKVSYRAHRIIWKMVHGTDPIEIDHINGARSDNRLSNLRSVAHEINRRNTRIRSSNKSGAVGVQATKNGKWDAYVSVGYNRYLGRFARFEDAVAARRSAERELGYHENNGRPA